MPSKNRHTDITNGFKYSCQNIVPPLVSQSEGSKNVIRILSYRPESIFLTNLTHAYYFEITPADTTSCHLIKLPSSISPQLSIKLLQSNLQVLMTEYKNTLSEFIKIRLANLHNINHFPSSSSISRRGIIDHCRLLAGMNVHIPGNILIFRRRFFHYVKI